MKNVLLLISVVIILLVLSTFISYKKIPTNISSTPTPTQEAVLRQQTKYKGCTVQGPYPDKACTPGAVFPAVIKDEVCQKGYSKNVRNVPISEKDQVYQEYGIVTRSPGQYEVDHFISLELGGSNDIANLWPEAADPKPGFHEKDKVENYLHQQVCTGSISLQEAQKQISTDWLKIYNSLPN